MPKYLKPIRANRGVAARYHAQLLALIKEMSASLEYWLPRQEPPVLAEDASPSAKMRKELNELAKRWLKRFDDAAPKIAESYVKRQYKASDSAMRAALKDARWTVKFQMTQAMQDAIDASILLTTPCEV